MVEYTCDLLDGLLNIGWCLTMPDYQDILASASQLPVKDRLRLITELASSVPDDQPPKLSAEWLAEIERRREEIKSGATQTESWSTIRERLFPDTTLQCRGLER